MSPGSARREARTEAPDLPALARRALLRQSTSTMAIETREIEGVAVPICSGILDRGRTLPERN